MHSRSGRDSRGPSSRTSSRTNMDNRSHTSPGLVQNGLALEVSIGAREAQQDASAATAAGGAVGNGCAVATGGKSSCTNSSWKRFSIAATAPPKPQLFSTAPRAGRDVCAKSTDA